jgi:macrolide transport system ATP-binding/permease protein
VELSGVSKIYGSGEGRVAALANVDLAIARGDFVAIMGQSGSGKTTLMNTVGCLDAPTSGRYRLDGRLVGDLAGEERARLRGRTLGFVFQRYNLLPALTALDNVALPAVYAGSGREGRQERARDLLESLGLGDKAASLPHQLSGGQQQRVGIARALMNGAQVILADEPSGALDSKSGDMVMDILASLHRRGSTVIVVTHDHGIAARADRVVELKDGEVVSDIRRRPAAEAPARAAPPASPGLAGRLAASAAELGEAMRMSLQAISSHKLRSALTMLGIIIGIASVVSVVALGRGSRERVLANIRSIGASTITINPGAGFGDRRSGRVRTLTVADSDLLGRQGYIDSSTPTASSSGLLAGGSQALNASLTGVGEPYFRTRGLALARGRFLTAMDVRESASVCVLDDNAARELMPGGGDPVGTVVIFRRQPLRVVGVAAPQQSAGGPQGQLNLWAPYTTVMTKITGDRHISSIIVKVADDVNTQVAEASLTELLKIRHGGRQDFHTQNADTIRQTIESTTATMTLLISSIALISLLVGGIGVMNIMLVSVTERTNEIGVRMAVGARSLDILEQFLIEAVLLCLLGGVAGVALSGLAALAFNRLSTDFPMSISTGSIVLALACSSLVGVVFGFLPARGASRLNPIEALAHE